MQFWQKNPTKLIHLQVSYENKIVYIIWEGFWCVCIGDTLITTA